METSTASLLMIDYKPFNESYQMDSDGIR
jgi:hypothetical protein